MIRKEKIFKSCKACKHYDKCSKDIYHASIEREYLINWSNRDCWEGSFNG